VGSLAEAVQVNAHFLDAPLRAVALGEEFSPFWHAGGPWHESQ
jgi:hypothetical protein